jgi:formylglycine-generating enzyme required for sulfatase activity
VLRVLRGGAFGYYLRCVRCAFRLRRNPDLGYLDFGFRPVLAPGFL